MTHAAQHPSAASAGPRWFPLNVMTALVLATVLGLLTYLLTSDGDPVAGVEDSEVAQPVAIEDTTPEAVAGASPLIAGSTISESVTVEAAVAGPVAGDSDASTERSLAVPVAAAGGALVDMGPTEVGYVTNFPTVEYTWERIELPGVGVSGIGWLGELHGRFVAISPVFTEDGSGAGSLVSWVSADGQIWERGASYSLPSEMWISRVVGDGERVVALGERWIEESAANEYTVLSTSDGETWLAAEPVIGAEDGEQVYVQDIAAGAAGVILSVQFETYPEEQPAVLVFEGYEVTLDHMRSSYTLRDTGSGDVVLNGVMDEIFNWSDDGQSIWNPETGELLTVVPYEIWEQSFNEFYEPGYGGSPLPVPIDSEQPERQPQVVVEYDGLVIEVNEYAGRFVVTDAESGQEIGGGTLEDLYQGEPPSFVDPDTGEVLLAVTWDEWHQAEEQSYLGREFEGSYDYRTRTALVTSADLETWDAETVGDGTGGSTSYLAATDDGFVAMVNTYEEYGGDSGTVWTMANGAWSSTSATPLDLWLHSVVDTPTGLVGVGDGSGGPALWTSPDGISWASEFAIVPQDDGSHAWLPAVAADDAGSIGALVVRERWSAFKPLVIVQDKYTATFEDGETVVSVTETESGELVLSLGWADFEDGPGSEIVAWDGEATSIDLGNGDVMLISDEDAYAAMDSRYGTSSQMGLSVFLNDGSGWTEAVVDVEGVIGGTSQVVLAEDRIIIGDSYWPMEAHPYEEQTEATLVIIVGTPVGG